MSDLISINDAGKAGITRLRLDHWTDPEDHIEIHITVSGELGPWIKFWSPTLERIGMKNPYEVIISEFDCDEKCWRPYTDLSEKIAKAINSGSGIENREDD